ncbi:MAG: CAP domain-containing protein [bacterium]
MLKKVNSFFKRIKSLFLKRKKLSIGIFFISLFVLMLTASLIYMYVRPNVSIEFNKDQNNIKYKSYSVFGGEMIVYKDDQEFKKVSLSPFSKNIDLDLTQDGIYKINIKVGNDNLNYQYEIDRTAPVITTEYPLITNQIEVPIKVTLNEEGTTQIKYTVYFFDEQNKEVGTDNAEEVFDNAFPVKTKEGKNTFSIIATDEWNNSKEESYEFITDFTKPKIELIKPTYNETYNASDTFQFKITDENGIAKVTAGENEIQGDANGVYSFKADYKDGDNMIKIVALDKANNSFEAQKGVMRKVSSSRRITQINNNTNNNNSNNNTGGTTSCNNGVSGYNIFCYLNNYRNDQGNPDLSWNSSTANYANAYAYCLETTGFSISSNPHNPTKEVNDCMTGKGFSTTKPYGGEVIAANRSSAKSYTDAFKASSTHWNIIGSSSAKNTGMASYGKWVVGYVGF